MRIEINSVSKVAAFSLAFVLVAPSIRKVWQVAFETYREAEVLNPSVPPSQTAAVPPRTLMRGFGERMLGSLAVRSISSTDELLH